MESDSLNLLEPSGLLQICNGIALPFSYCICDSSGWAVATTGFALTVNPYPANVENMVSS
jgi:hypothetical protein